MTDTTTPQEEQSQPPADDGQASPPKGGRRWTRVLRNVLIFLLGLTLFLQLPFVQNWIAKKVVNTLEDTLETKVTLDNARIRYLDILTLDNLFVEDIYGDTLMMSGNIHANFNLNPFVLFRRGLEIEALELSGTRFNIRRHVGDKETNLQVAISRLIPPKDTTNKKKGLPINLQELVLEDVAFTKVDSINGSELSIHLEKGQIWLNDLNVHQPSVDINTVNLTRPTVTVLNYHGTGLSDSTLLTTIADDVVPTDGSLILIEEFRLSGGSFALTNHRKGPIPESFPNQINFQRLETYDINIEIDSFRFERDTFTGQINWIAAKEKSGFALEKLVAKEAIICATSTTLNDLSIITPTGILGDSLYFRYREYLDWEEFPDKVRMDLRLHDASVALTDIMSFAPKLRENRFFVKNKDTQVHLDGRIRGKINNLSGKNLNIQLAGDTKILGDFSTNNLAVKGEEFLLFNLKQLNTNMHTLRDLIPNFNPPSNFDRLGRLSFSGNFTGFTYDFTAKGDLRTEIGRATVDMQMVINDGPQEAQYSGALNLINFDVGAWNENPDFGLVNFSSEVANGRGLTGDVATADLTAAIENFTFKGYTYNNAEITGELNKNFFNGDFSIQDENIDFSFGGELDFRDEIPEFDFLADIKKLDLGALNLSKQDLVLAGKIDLNLRNTTFSNMEGNLRANAIDISKNGTENYHIDSIVAYTLFDDQGEKVFRLESDIAEGEVKGSFDLDEVPIAFKNFLVRNHPEFSKRLNINLSNKEIALNQFAYHLQIYNSKGLNYLLSPKLGVLENTRIDGSFNGIDDALTINIELPVFKFGKVRLQDAFIQLDADGKAGDLDIVIDSTFLNEKTKFGELTFLSIFEADSLNFGLNYKTMSHSLLDKVSLNGLLFLPDSVHYGLQFKQSNLSLLELPWKIDEDNTIFFGNNTIVVDDFTLTNQSRKISLDNLGKKGLKLRLSNMDFSFIDDIWDYDPLDFNGAFDLSVEVRDLFKMEDLRAAIKCDTFQINDDDFGGFQLDATAPNLKSQAAAYLSITKDTMQLLAEANFNLANLKPTGARPSTKTLPIEFRKNHLDLRLNFSSYPLNIAEYWLTTGLNNTVGKFDADLRIKGMPSLPDVDGYISVKGGALTIESLQTRYSIPSGFVTVDNFIFDATGTILRDKYGNKALMFGGITHHHLKNLGLGARLRTQRFLGLELEKGDNELFYGRALGSGEVQFSGNFIQPHIYVNATAADSTEIVIPISDSGEASALDFVDFLNKHQQTQTTQSESGNRLTGLELEMDLSITPAADFQLVFDEQAGDIIKGNGRGDIRILLPRSGDFQMFGDVVINEGDYLFTLYDVINKDFKINPGGTIKWNGDPYQAQLDIEAVYKDLNVPVSNFIQEYLIDGANNGLKAEAAQATDVSLILKLQGELLKPNIGFDIFFPELRGPIQTYSQNKLRVLRQDSDEMNRQVFGLIVIGQFLPSDLSFNSGDIIANTLSEYFSNQLSLLATQLFSEAVGEDNLLSGAAVDFVYTPNATSTAGTSDLNNGRALELSVKQNFANDRLTIQIGGNVGFGEEFIAINNGAFIGEEVVIEYALNKTHDFKLRIFYGRKPDVVGGGRRLETGTGLSWRREFNSFSEFWKSLKNSNKKDEPKS